MTLAFLTGAPRAAQAADPWSGTVTASVGTTTTDANSPETTLTLTLSKPLTYPYAVSVYDDLGNRLYCDATAGYSSYPVGVSPATNATRTYTAYVAQDCPTPGPPTNDVKATSSATVSNVGYTGTVTASVGTTTTDANSPGTTLTMTLSKPMALPYAVSVYDDLGNRLYCDGRAGYSSYPVGVSPATNATRTYTAYVAQDCPTSGPPTNDVRTAAAVTYNSGAVGSSSQDGIDLDVLAAQLAALAPSEVDAIVTEAPGTHLAGSSVTDQNLAYEGARNSGKSTRAALAAAAAGAGTGGGFFLYVRTHASPAAAPPAAPAGPLPPPAAPSPDPYPSTAQPTYEDDLTASLLARNPNVSVQAARIAARQCIATAQAAIGAGTLPGMVNGQYPCDGTNVYLPGSDFPNTTQHDYEALFGSAQTSGNLSWAQLHYVSRADKRASGLDPGWARSQPACAGETGGATGKDCDEYPFYASAESGPGASLRPMQKAENSGAGSRYGGFVVSCRLVSGGQVQASQATGTPFLVVPMNFPGAPPTLHFCGSS